MARVARAPNHLGDAIMAQPALIALARQGPLIVQGPAFLHDVVGHVPGITVQPPGPLSHRVEEALLFTPSLRAAWQARRARRRIGTPTDGRRWLLTDAITRRPGHRSETYAAIAGVVGAHASGAPQIPVSGAPSADVPEGHIGLNPIVKGGVTRAWPAFGALARRMRQPVVFYGGPSEHHAVAAVADRHRQCVGLPLAVFATTLQRCALFVSNDSGAAHFARAVGARVLVVYGSTVPERTGPAGAFAVRGAPVPCAPCYRNRCPTHRECLAVPVQRVVEAVRAVLGG